MANSIKRKIFKSIYALGFMALVSYNTLTASHLFDHDQTARNQSFEHPQFGITFGINIFPVSNFVKDSNDRQHQWEPGSNYYRNCVLPQEGIDTYKAYQMLDQLYRENHPDIACKFETLMAKKEPSMPFITHSVWFTNQDSPKELTEQFLEWYTYSCGLHLKDKGWKHYLWVQDRTKLPHTTGFLEHRGIEIKEISKTLTDDDFCGLKNHVYHEISQSKFGRAADIFRCVILKKYGGIYRDIDFVMTRPFTGLALAYTFFAGIEYAYSYPCNAIMGCRPDHPIMSKMIENMKRNFDPKLAPAYIQDSLQKHGDLLHTLCTTGPIALGVALHTALLSKGPTSFGEHISQKVNEQTDRTIIFPPEVFFAYEGGRDINAFGVHAFSGTWLKPEFGSKG
ncbi:glycosyltransferase [Candidatus Finniella inopinata]|uniref:Mannosyltransferase n=1 Tax=Candidatus Finniella inopinata TaxID=1696036 RepID=A0A4Q7DLB9_9PROT|nr:glycosyltransferase [Candidatus Finniella inopinata]RZI47045.1 hypothetical protein EQU50_00205 [Candidatus Finniella inopinata]